MGGLDCDISRYLTDALSILSQYINQYLADTQPIEQLTAHLMVLVVSVNIY